MTRDQAEMALERGMKVAGECIDKGYNMLVTAEMASATQPPPLLSYRHLQVLHRS